jgi:type I restriction enzyme S subunit
MVETTEWEPTKLDKLGLVGRGKSRHRPRNASFLYGGPYPFFQTGDIKAANFYLTEYSQTYSEEGLAQSKLWKPGTLCITIAANIAESAILGIEGCFPDSVVGFVPDPAKADVRFIKYYLEILKLRMQNVSHGATQDNLSVDKLLSFDFLVPPLPVQCRIAGVLSAYDELIENSQRRIQMLEAMARALYREWFVRPCRSGNRPNGWREVTVGDILTLNYGKSLTKKTRRPGPYPVAGSSGISGFHDEFLVTGPGVIVGRAGSAGLVHWIQPNFFPIDSAFFVEPQDEHIGLRFIYFMLTDLDLPRLISGAAVPGINRNAVYAERVILPSNDALVEFEAVCQHFFDLKHTLEMRRDNLRRTRDLLLPRLLSGQLELEAV